MPKKIQANPSNVTETWSLNIYTFKIEKIRSTDNLVLNTKTFQSYKSALKAKIKLMEKESINCETAIISYENKKLKLGKDLNVCREELKKIESKS